LTISALARNLGIAQAVVSKIVNGRRLSAKTEQRIAEHLGKPAGYLFPERLPEEMQSMRQAEAAKKGKAA
jgi:transcriptional regulator with XRE-family HTH domain